MATVTPVPFAVALLVALAAFGAWMWFLVRESRRPYHWPEPRAIVEPPPARPPLHVIHGIVEPEPTHKVGNTRLAVLVATFLLWSLWSTGRSDRVDSHH